MLLVRFFLHFIIMMFARIDKCCSSSKFTIRIINGMNIYWLIVIVEFVQKIEYKNNDSKFD